MIAAGAGATGCVALLIMDRWEMIKSALSKRPVASVMLIAGPIAFGLLLTWRIGLIDQLRSAPLWAGANIDRPQYYFVAFRQELPLLWPLLPLAAVAAIADPALRLR